MSADETIAWLPFVYASEFRSPASRGTNKVWVGDRAPFAIEPTPGTTPVIILRSASGRTIVFGDDGENLHREVLKPNGEPLTTAALKELDGSGAYAAGMFLARGRNDGTWVDYPLTVNHRDGEAGPAPAAWRESIEQGKGGAGQSTFRDWKTDGREAGLNAARQKALDLSIKDDVIHRKSPEPLICVQSLDDAATVFITIWFPPDQAGNDAARKALIPAGAVTGPTLVKLNYTDLSATTFFRIDQADLARACAQEAAAAKGDNSEGVASTVIDLLPEIEISPNWRPEADTWPHTLATMLDKLQYDRDAKLEWNPQAPSASTVCAALASRALKLHAAGDGSLMDHAMNAIAEAATDPTATARLKEFGILEAAARRATERHLELEEDAPALTF